MVRDGSLSGLRTTFRRIAITAATVALVAAAPPVFAADPAFTAFPILTPNAGLSPIAPGPDGAMWFTGSDAGIVGRIAQDGSVEEYLLDPASHPSGIAAGPDGSMWFTMANAEAIGRLTPAGELVTYPLPADESSPAGITAGPDGAMWFTERLGARIGRIDPATDEITEFGLEGSSGPTAITTGPDGGIWFIESFVPALGRIDPITEEVDRIDLPANSLPIGVASADGALWVTLRATNEVARVAPDGAMVLFTVPTVGSRPSHIAADPVNEVLWFTERATSRLVRLSYDGTMTEYDADGGGGLSGIAVDAAGRPWVTQSTANTIGRLDLQVVPPDTTSPTITISSPGAGAWTVLGSGALAAGYGCADEGGSGVATCEGTVADGAGLPDGALGAARLEVHAADGAGNTAEAAAAYLVFGSVTGGVVDPTPARPGEGLTLELGMGLPSKAQPLATALSTPVACGTGQALGDPEPADVRIRITHLGELSIRWITGRTWSGCRSLTLSFSEPGWAGADAVFGPIGFAAKR